MKNTYLLSLFLATSLVIEYSSVCLSVSDSNIMDYRNSHPFSLTQSWVSRRYSLCNSKLPPSSTFKTQSQVTVVIVLTNSSQHPRENLYAVPIIVVQ